MLPPINEEHLADVAVGEVIFVLRGCDWAQACVLIADWGLICAQAVGVVLRQQEVPEELRKGLADAMATSDDCEVQHMLSSIHSQL